MKKVLRKKNKGFTLVELVVVIAIIAVLAAVIIPTSMKALDKAKVSAAIADAKNVKTAIYNYYTDTGEWPTTPDALTAAPSGVTGWDGPYLDKWPKDPWKNGDFTLSNSGNAVTINNVPSNDCTKLNNALGSTTNSDNTSVTLNIQ